MKTRLLTGAAAFVFTATLVPLAAAQPETTRPGIVYRVNVFVTDSSIRVQHARYVRGAIIRYHVRNRGTRPYRFLIAGLTTEAIRPGREATILVNWNYRGRFPYRTQVKLGGAWRNTGLKGYITIF